jgi:hypothetical protein
MLPDDIGALLVAYGQDEFGLNRSSSPTDLLDSPAARAVAALSKLQFAPDSGQVLDELIDAANDEGGWAIYGASYAVMAFLPSANFTSAAESLHAARIEFLRSLDPSDRIGGLKPDDVTRWRDLHPGEV